MILRKFIKHVKDQNWFAVGLDEIVVIIGIFLGRFINLFFPHPRTGARMAVNMGENL